MYIACIDTGTTNTRVCIRDEKSIYAIIKRDVGVRITSIQGNNHTLITTVADAYQEALSTAGITESDVSIILASGMISSNLGLLEVPHLVAPVSITDLANGIVKTIIPQISEIHPIHFIPGVRNYYDESAKDSATFFSKIDMMRGEEVEAFAIMELEHFQGPAVLILTGSHTKFVYVNEKKEITSCLTTMAGELLMQFTFSTIISQSLNYAYADEIDEKYLISGAKTCLEMGLTRASFCVRSLEQFSSCSNNQRENFLLGAVLEEDLRCIHEIMDSWENLDYNFIVCGNGTLGKGFYTLLKNVPQTAHRTYSASEESMKGLSSYGCVLVAKEAGLI